MTTQDLSIARGNALPISITITYSDGSAYDLTGATVYFTVKRDYTDTTATIQEFTATHTDPTGGETYLETTSTDIEAGCYVYDIQVKDSADKIFTVMGGKFTVINKVT